MKKLLLLLGLLAPVALQAQTLPNNGFETWTTTGLRESPNGWYSLDDLVATQLPISLGFATKTTDRHAGNFAVQLQSKQVAFPGLPFTGYVPSVLFVGAKINPQNPETAGGIPFTSRPGSVRFWYKLTLAPNDSAVALAALSRGPRSAQGNFIGTGGLDLPARSTFGQAAYNMEYAPGTLTPDTLRLGFVVGTGSVSAGSTLIVDEVTFGARVTSNKQSAALAASLSVYPNPSSTGEFALASLDNPAVATAPLSVTDALGREVYREGAAPRSLYNGRALRLQNQQPGLYLLRLETPTGLVTRRLVIR
ncbi:T9SS type A sorting domain-containing protein [Hymenobacter latericus]|uniref:T9SS type A sorting domain-containing protein n=1 Tax=Hymenobacter sp. YIM 151858-1 TaxID=2987688 RepID=UPI002226D9E7|nr:T9SS type A sorting domain-containing protein [Hymenobacter sp. YIM 151858-1]UYZ59372.1 T9SS type A sorting domain-containing protein [Hymenobacter sp. YIM 151858-1]